MLVAASKYSYVGIFFAVAICVGFFIGHWLDGRFHTEPWLTVVGLLIGVASGFRELLRLSRQALREEQRDEQGQDEK